MGKSLKQSPMRRKLLAKGGADGGTVVVHTVATTLRPSSKGGGDE